MNNKSFISYYKISLVMISFSLLVSCNYYPLISSPDSINKVVLSFDSNGGNELDQISFIVGEAVIMPDNPNKLGYQFDGWYLDETFSNQVNAQTILDFNINHDISVIAKWSAINYNLNYVLDDGFNASINPSTYTIEDSFILESATKSGYNFIGWYDQGGLNAIKIKTINVGTNQDLTLYAKYELVDYQVSYELYGGYVNTNPTTYNVLSEIILNTPYLYGYDFGGWFDNELTYGNPIFTLGQDIALDIKLYARWVPVYNPYIDWDGGNDYIDPPKLNPVMVVSPQFDTSLVYGNLATSLVINGEMSTEGNFFVSDGLEYLPVGNHSLSYEFIPTLSTYNNFIGTLEISVLALEVSFTAQSQTRPYNGLPLVSDNVFADCGCLAFGHRAEFEMVGSQTDVGISPNYVTNVIIYNELDIIVTDNYDISYVNGTLEVLALIGSPIIGLDASNYFQIGFVINQTATTNQDGEIAWYSSDISIASIDINSGIVAANNSGTVSIYYISDSMHGSSTDIYIYPQTIINNPQIDTVQLGEPLVTPKAFTLPYLNQSIAWSSSVVATATIDQVSGEISPIAVGATNISYVVIDDVYGLIIASGNIDIQTGAYATITNPTITNVTVNGDSIYPAGYPVPTAGQSIEWVSSNLDVATINITTGEIVALSEGTSIISYRTKVDATDQVVYKGQVELSVIS